MTAAAHGRLGHSDTLHRDRPTRVSLLASLPVSHVAWNKEQMLVYVRK